MSGTQQPPPPPRGLTSTARVRFGKVLQHRSILLTGAAIIALTGGAWFFGGSKKQDVPLYSSAKVLPSSYQPPPVQLVAAKPPPLILPIVPAAASTQPLVAEKKQEAPAIKMTSISYRIDPPTPKPADPDPAHSGITQKGSDYTANMAFALPHPEYMLPQFSKIPCVLDTKIITGVSGLNPFTCHLPQAIYSPYHVLLMEAGTTIGGFYQSTVAEGDSRIVMASATARTPNQIIVPLTGDPIADMTGAAGVEGDVNNHWVRRIAGGLILSLMDAGLSLGQSVLQSGSGNNQLNLGSVGGSTSALGDLARQISNKEMQIPPTIVLNQGTLVTFWTTKEFTDFSRVYAIRSVR